MTAVYWHAYQGLVIKQLRRFLRSWVQSLLPSVVTAGVFMLIFGHFVGRELAAVQGQAYADFIMPGLVMFAVVSNAYSNSSLAFFGARLQRHIEEMLVAPMPAWLIVAGFATASTLRGLLAGALVALLAMPFTAMQFHHVGVGLTVAVFTALLFSLLGLINGVFARNFDDTSLISTFVLTPLTYLGGVFYPAQLLPAPWQSWSLANPMMHIVEGFRYGLLDTPAVNLPLTFIFLPLLTAVAAVTAWALVARGVRIKD